jgi:hypothetical protein
VRVEHPTPRREAAIIASRTPDADVSFHREMAGIALSFRNYSLEKPPSVSEMIDFANAFQILGADHVTEEHRDILLPSSRKQRRTAAICFFARVSRACWTTGHDLRPRWRSGEAQTHEMVVAHSPPHLA